MTDTPEPIVCRMDALTTAGRARRGEVLDILRGRLIGTTETDDGIAFTLSGGPEVPALAREFISYESRCCAFLRFGFDVQDGGRRWSSAWAEDWESRIS